MLRCRLHSRPAAGGDVLQRQDQSEPHTHQRGLGLLGSLCCLLKGFEGAENHRRWLDRYGAEVHHTVPSCLLRLYDAASEPGLDGGRHIQAWLDFEHGAMRWRVPVDISRADLERLVEASAEVMEREAHRAVHASDWRRWGRRGGLATLRRYGTDWYALLALRRWGRITAADLDAARAVVHRAPVR